MGSITVAGANQAHDHKAKTICMLFKDRHVEKLTNRHGMELYKQKIGDEWVLAPFPLILEEDDPANYAALWTVADEFLAE